MQQLNWKPVHEYEDLYEINELGQVRSLKRRNHHLIVQSRVDRGGYCTIRLRKNGKQSTLFIHRLLGYAFITNPDNKPYINHKDGNKLNNSLDNLEWVTHAENMKHAYANNLCQVPEKYCKKVVDTCTNAVYRSISEAAKALNIGYSTCKNYLNGRRPNPTCLRYAT